MGKYFDVSYMIQAFPQLLNYVHVTVLITVISAILGVILGSIIAIIRLKKVPVLNQLFIVFISFMRGTPFLVQLFLIYFGVPEIMSHMGLNMKNVPGLVFVITVIELFGAAKLYTEENSQYFEAYIVVAGLFWVMGIVFEFIFHRLEIYASKYKRGNAL